MDTFVVTAPDGTTTEWVNIDNGDGTFTAMTKEYYEAQQAPLK